MRYFLTDTCIGGGDLRRECELNCRHLVAKTWLDGEHRDLVGSLASLIQIVAYPCYHHGNKDNKPDR